MSRRTAKPRSEGASVAVGTKAASDAPARGRARAVTAIVSGPALVTARVEDVDGQRVRIAIGGQTVVALRDPTLHPVVLKGAQRRGERVLVERGADGVWVVLGALRTQPTPGIDPCEELTIEADKVSVRAQTEVTVAAGPSSVAVRAEGEIESNAPRIESHAEGLHKITGRMLRLN